MGNTDNYELMTEQQKREMWEMVKKIKGGPNPDFTWWQRMKFKIKFEKKLTERKRANFVYWWIRYGNKDCPERDALMNFITTEERQMRDWKVGDLLWEEGYRHGDHVLVYDPVLGSFRERVVLKSRDPEMRDYVFLEFLDMVAEWEEGHGKYVKPEDRTQRKSQPNFKSHEH